MYELAELSVQSPLTCEKTLSYSVRMTSCPPSIHCFTSTGNQIDINQGSFKMVQNICYCWWSLWPQKIEEKVFVFFPATFGLLVKQEHSHQHQSQAAFKLTPCFQEMWKWKYFVTLNGDAWWRLHYHQFQQVSASPRMRISRQINLIRLEFTVLFENVT